MPAMPENRGEVLLPIARATISSALGRAGAAVATDLPWLLEKGACFVTLNRHGQLRGCIGTLRAHRSLQLDVQANAHAAAFCDPRFSPLAQDELEQTRIEISLLSAMQPLHFSGERDAWAQLRPGIDGVVFEFGHCRSTFLPQVWEQLPDVATFMAHLKHKAGLPADFWAGEVKLSRYTVSKWKEVDIERLHDD